MLFVEYISAESCGRNMFVSKPNTVNMKLIHVAAAILLVSGPFHANAQKWKEKLNKVTSKSNSDSAKVFESQDVVAGKWAEKDVYLVRVNDSGIMKPSSKDSVKIIKDSNGKAVKVEFRGDTYKLWDPNDTDWASGFSYNHMNNLCFFENSIVKYHFDYSSKKVAGVKFVIGKGMGGPGKVKKAVQEYLDYGLAKIKSDKEAAERKRAEHKAKYSIVAQTVESIEIQIISDQGDKLDCGSKFRVGYIVKTKEGNTIKSKSLGGEAYVNDYNVSVIGADREYIRENGELKSYYDYTAKPYCEGYDDKHLVIQVVSRHDENDKAEKRILTTCKPDPAIIAAREAEKKRLIEEEKRRKEYAKKQAAEERARALAAKNNPAKPSGSGKSTSTVKPSGSYHGIAQFTKVDTIYHIERYFSSQTNNMMGVIKDGNDYIVARIALGKAQDAVKGEKATEYYIGTRRLNRKSQEMSSIDLMAKPNSSRSTKCKMHLTLNSLNDNSGLPSISKFIKVPEGYLLVGSQAAIWYNKTLDILHKEVLESTSLTDAGIMADVIPISGKPNLYAMLTVDSDGTSRVQMVNVLNGKKSSGEFRLNKKVSRINHKSAKLFQVSKDNVMAWYKSSIDGDESKYYQMNVFSATKLWSSTGEIQGESISEGSDYFKARVPNLGNLYSIWSDKNYVVHMMASGDGSDLEYQIKFGTALDDFKLAKSVNPAAVFGEIMSLQNSELMRPFKGGYMFVDLVTSAYSSDYRGTWRESHMNAGYSFDYFDKDMNYVRSYVFKTKYDEELHDRRLEYFRPNNIAWHKLKGYSGAGFYFKNQQNMDYSTTYALPEGFMRDFEEFQAANNCIDFAETSDPNKIVIMTNSAIMEVDLRDAKPFNPKGKESNYTYVPPSEDTETSASSSTTSNPESFYIKNETGHRLYYVEKGSSNHYWLARGENKAFKCSDEIYHSIENSDGKRSRGALMGSGANSCGKTVVIE